VGKREASNIKVRRLLSKVPGHDVTWHDKKGVVESVI
jgi:hypothetical protein